MRWCSEVHPCACACSRPAARQLGSPATRQLGSPPGSLDSVATISLTMHDEWGQPLSNRARPAVTGEGGCEPEHQRSWENACRLTRQANMFCVFTALAVTNSNTFCTLTASARVCFLFLKNTEVACACVLTATITELKAKKYFSTETLAETKAKPMA